MSETLPAEKSSAPPARMVPAPPDATSLPRTAMDCGVAIEMALDASSEAGPVPPALPISTSPVALRCAAPVLTVPGIDRAPD